MADSPSPEFGPANGRYGTMTFMTSPIRVLIADDQEMIRAGFRFFLDAQPDITVIAEAIDGEDAVAAARRLRPDVCLFDIRMPKMDGLTATRLLAGPDVTDPLHVVVVTTFDLDEYVYTALTAGACGFLLKNSGAVLLAEAVRAASAGDSLVSPSITVRLLKHLTAGASQPPDAIARHHPSTLSDRELDVVRLVAVGHTNAEIAVALHLALSTVKTHLTSIQGKLAARNRVEIAAWAWRSGHGHPGTPNS
jgi:DNA-binding NarL/FixJ family response regulator